jgi:hypothetical protein
VKSLYKTLPLSLLLYGTCISELVSFVYVVVVVVVVVVVIIIIIIIIAIE